MPKHSQRGFAHLFLLIFLIAGVAIGIYLVQHPTFFRPHASGLDIGSAVDSCQVSDAASLKTCFSKAQKNETDNIEFTRMIDCIGLDACKVLITRQGSIPLNIYGTPGKNAGFHRSPRNTDKNSPEYIADVAYDVLVFTASENVTLKDLIFIEDKPYDTGDNIRVIGTPLAFLPGSKNITLDHITTINAKKLATEFSGVTNLTIKNSKFIGSGVTGIWMDRANELTRQQLESIAQSPALVDEKMSHFVTIDNNFFVDTNTGAVNFIGIGTPDNPNKLTNNFLVHNHSFPAFRDSAGGLVPGAQMIIERNKNSIVEGNVIKDGSMGLGAVSRYTSGIETADLLENVIIRGNIVTNNDGAGLFADYRDYPNWKIVGSTVKVTGNEFSNNGYDDHTRSVQIFDQEPRDSTDHFFNVTADNCFSANCGHIQMGKIYANPIPCNISKAGDTCQTTLHWYTHNPDGPVEVRVLENPGSVVGTADNGTADIPWIPESGATFELYAGNVKLDSVFINAQSAALPTGQITATTCSIPTGETRCSSTINWLTANTVGPVQVRRQNIQGAWADIGPSGSVSYEYVTNTPTVFELYDGVGNDHLLGSVTVQAVQASQPVQASQSIPIAPPTSISPDNHRLYDLNLLKNATLSVKTAKGSWCSAYGCLWGTTANDPTYGMNGTAANSMKAIFVTPKYINIPLNDPNCPEGHCSNWSDYYMVVLNDNEFTIYAKLDAPPASQGCTPSGPYNYCITQ